MIPARKLLALVVSTLLIGVAPPGAKAADPPGAPVGLTVVGGSDWRSVNAFDLTWQNPAARGTGIERAQFAILDLVDRSPISTGVRKLSGGSRLNSLAMPERGEFLVELRLEDSAGNQGSPGSVEIRFDDARPGDVVPEGPDGWISDDELPYEQVVSLATPGGPSGVAGYALAISEHEAIRPCPTGICAPAQMSMSAGPEGRVLTIPGLAEGNHWLSAVAVSGSGLTSVNPGTERLRVDRTEPVSKLSGVPAGWVNRPVTVEATATDSASGMEVRPDLDDGNPVTAIRAGDQPALVVQGGTASLQISREGATRVQYWARDLAGNVNDGGLTDDGDVRESPGEAVVRIDRRAPVVTIGETRDPADPEVVRALVSDAGSGLDAGTIAFRRSGADGFTELATTIQGDDALIARLPSDELPAGRYEIRAEAIDRAGNRGLSTDVAKAPVLDLPLKRPTAISIRFAKGPSSSARSAMIPGRAVRVKGTARSPDGTVFAGAEVLVEQRFATGSRRRHTSSIVRTDGAGRFAARLEPGPSRTVWAGFAGTRTDQPATSRRLKLVASDRVRFQTNPALLVNGGTAVMSGRVTGEGARQPAGGKLVTIQYFDPSRTRWRPVEVIRADRRGRFSYRYRFRTIAYAQKILFRAVSLPESGWPFRTTASHRRTVIVYPASQSSRAR